MKSAITVLMITVCLSSCAPASFSGLACPPVPVYPAEQQRSAAAELAACATYAPANFCRELFTMMDDYHIMRRQSLACRQSYARH